MLLCSSCLDKFIHSIIFYNLSRRRLQSQSLLYFSNDHRKKKSEIGIHECTKMSGKQNRIIGTLRLEKTSKFI